MAKVTFPGTDVKVQCGEWRTSPYSRVRVGRARKEYRCARCGVTIPKGEPVFRLSEVDPEGWWVEVVCYRHVSLKRLLDLQQNPTWGRTG